MQYKPMTGTPPILIGDRNPYMGRSWWERFVVWTNTGKFPSGQKQTKEVKGTEIQNP